MTKINPAKITENTRALGTKPVKIDSMEKRGYVRKLLNGLGFSTEQYIDANQAQLEGIYNELLNSQGMALSVCMKDCTPEQRSIAVMEFDNVKRGMGDMPEPIATPIMIAIETPVKKETTPMVQDKANELAQAIAKIMSGVQPLDESRVVELIKEHGAGVATRVEIITGAEVKTIEGLHHKALPDLTRALKAGVNIMLVGPAGSGKTTLAHMAAEALGVDFYFNGAISSEYKLTGFIDAQGRIVSTAFRKAYEGGGLYLFDEIDASMPDALLAFNAALANGHMDFPDGTIKRHADFYCVAAANTFGTGADRVYVGRNQLDAASLDRFMVLNIDYDEKLERALAGNDNWTDTVQAIRARVFEHKIRHVVSPRAAIGGAKLLAAGFSREFVLESMVFKGLDTDAKRKIAG